VYYADIVKVIMPIVKGFASNSCGPFPNIILSLYELAEIKSLTRIGNYEIVYVIVFTYLKEI